MPTSEVCKGSQKHQEKQKEMEGVAIIFTLSCKSLFSSAEQSLAFTEPRAAPPAAKPALRLCLGFSSRLVPWEKEQFRE